MLWEDEAPAESRSGALRSVCLHGRTIIPARLWTWPISTATPLATKVETASRLRQQFAERTLVAAESAPWGAFFSASACSSSWAGWLQACYFLKSYLERDSRFRIAGAGNIQATGLTEVSRAEMLPVFGEDIGRNIFFVPLAERRKQLEADSLGRARHGHAPAARSDSRPVVERQPVAFVAPGQQIGLVDANGVLLDHAGRHRWPQHHYSFPVVTGIDPGDPPPSRKARMAVYQRLMAELDANGQHFSEQISEIDLTDPEDARVLMPEQGADILAHFGDDHFLERYQRYKAHIAEWRQQYPKLAAVDLRYDQQVVLEMAPGAGAAQATADDQAAQDATAPSAHTASRSSREIATGRAAKPRSQAEATHHQATAKPGESCNSQTPETAAAKNKAAKDKKRAEPQTASR